MSRSPLVVPFGSDNVEVGVKDGVATIANQRGFLGVGYDGANYRFFRTDTSGYQIVVGSGTAGTPAGGVVSVQGVSGGQALPVSAASLPLPTGAATESTLATLLTESTFTTRIPVNGQALMAASIPVVIASDQSAIPVSQNGTWTVQQGTPPWAIATEVQLDYDTSAGTQNLSVIGLGLPSATGVVAGGTSTDPLRVDPTGTTTQPVSAASWPLPTGAATEATLAAIDASVDVNISTRASEATLSSIDGNVDVAISTRASEATLATLLLESTFTARVPVLALGGGLESGALRVTIANDSTGLLSVDDNGGSLTTDTPQLPGALVGGRLDTNVGAWMGSTAPTIGQKTMANSLPIVIASDQSPVDVAQSGTWTVQQGTPPWTVAGTDADGAAPTQNPVLTAGYDGTNVQTKLTDTSGRQRIVGAAADGAAVTGDPVLVGGQDGTNAQSLKTNSDGRLEQVLYDGSGNPVGVILDGSVYRLQTEAAQGTKAATADAWPTVLVDSVGNYIDTRLENSLRRLYTTLSGETVSVAVGGVPANAASIVNATLKDSGSSGNLLVNGSVTAVDFEYGPSGSDRVGLYELRFFFSADNINFNGADFGAINAITNGLRISIVVDSVETELGNITHNEQFGLVGSPSSIFYQNTGPADSLAVAVPLAGLVLDAATSDLIRVRVRDNLVSVKHKFFRCEVNGVVQ